MHLSVCVCCVYKVAGWEVGGGPDCSRGWSGDVCLVATRSAAAECFEVQVWALRFTVESS